MRGILGSGWAKGRRSGRLAGLGTHSASLFVDLRANIPKHITTVIEMMIESG